MHPLLLVPALVAAPSHGVRAPVLPAPVTAVAPIRRAAFHDAMRQLWEDHITWTRLYIVSAAAGLPDADQTAQRLLRNQADIGDAIKSFYGEAAGAGLTALLRGHILTAAKLIGAERMRGRRALQPVGDVLFCKTVRGQPRAGQKQQDKDCHDGQAEYGTRISQKAP